MKFGDVGHGSAGNGGRMVMFISPDQAVILSAPDDDDLDSSPGAVTYSITGTTWGIRSDLDIAEALDIYRKGPNMPTELLK